MAERTEEDGLDAILLIRLGSEVHELRTLTIVESDEWLAQVSVELARVDLPAIGQPIEGEPDAALARFLTESSAAALRLVAAYDRDGVLGGEEAIRAVARKRDIRVALERMVEAEDPFGEDAVRSVATAFGAPSRSLWRMTAAFVAASLLATSTAGPAAVTASDGETSDDAGPGSSSSSDGPTPITMKRRSAKSA